MLKHSLILIACLPLFLIGCAQTVEVSTTAPATASRMQRIAVLNADSSKEHSTAATQRLIQRITQSGIYQVVDEPALQQAAPEQLRDDNGKLQKQVAGEAGRRMRLDGLVVSSLRTRDSSKEMRLRFGAPVVGATAMYTWVELPSGRLRDSQQSQHAEPATGSVGGQMQKCVEESVDKLASKLAPNLETVSRELAGSSWFGDLSEGNRLAADSKWQAAEAAWDKVAREDPKNDGAWYNLGIAAEARGDRQLAHERYQRANQITDKGEYRIALQRMNESLLAEQLARQQQQRHAPHLSQQRLARQPNQPASYSGNAQFRR